MPTVRRLLCVSFALLSLVSTLDAAVVGVVINIDGKAISGAKVSLFAPELITAQGPRLMSAEPQRKHGLPRRKHTPIAQNRRKL